MRNLLRCTLSLGLAATLAACGTTSGLTRQSSNDRLQIANYDRVEVLDVTASDARKLDSPEKQAEYDASLVEARRVFADRIAEQVTESGAFATVARSRGTGPALRVSGDITQYDEGNIVARGLTGFVGRTRFDATVTFTDAGTGQVLDTITIDRNSWPLPVGASLSTLQTTNHFMGQAAKKIAAELAAKKTATD